MNERIKQIRKSKGLTQKEFANKIEMTQQAINRIEKNLTLLTEKNIKLICQEFNVNENWLRTGEGEMFDERPKKAALDQIETEYTLTAPEKSFIERYLSWPPERRIALAEMIK